MNLDKSISNLSKRIERFDSFDGDGNDSNHWKDKAIIPLNDWIQLRGTPYALEYFPDNFDKVWTFLTESDLKNSDEQTRKWYSDYLDLMEFRRNPNYGRTKCFHCLLSSDSDDPIFIGINRLVAKGLESKDSNTPPEYPCHVVNRFECPYEKGKVSNTKFDVEDLFNLAKMPFAVEIALAKARKEDAMIRIKSKEDLLHALTETETFGKILEQGEEALQESEYLRKYSGQDKDNTINYFMKIKDKVDLEELRFY
ncbi:MAG: hypothetical protein WA631_09380 [Nitrososphaeraceae archaeon]